MAFIQNSRFAYQSGNSVDIGDINDPSLMVPLEDIIGWLDEDRWSQVLCGGIGAVAISGVAEKKIRGR